MSEAPRDAREVERGGGHRARPQPLLPRPFRYFGLWLLVCFLPQAVLSAALMV